MMDKGGWIRGRAKVLASLEIKKTFYQGQNLDGKVITSLALAKLFIFLS